MAELTRQQISTAGIVPTLTAAAAAGDTVDNNGKTFLHVVNANVGDTRTVTINSLVACNQGFDHDIAVTVAASSEEFIGPFPQDRFNNSAGEIAITYSDSAADITIAAFSV